MFASLPADQAGDRAVSIFGLPAESDWVLNGPYSDKTQLNNYLSFLWSNKMGLYAPRARLVEVVLESERRLRSITAATTWAPTSCSRRSSGTMNVSTSPNFRRSITGLPEITGGYIWKKDKDGAGDVPFQTNSGQVNSAWSSRKTE